MSNNTPKIQVMQEPIDALHVSVSKSTDKLGPLFPSVSTMPGNAPIIVKKDGRQLCDVIGTCGRHCSNGCFGNNGDGYCYIAKLIKFRSNMAKSYAKNTRIMREDPARFVEEAAAGFKSYFYPYGRFNVSGEVTNPEILELYYQICYKCPSIQFGIYTRAIDIIEAAADQGRAIPANLCVNRSMDGKPTAEDVARAKKYGYQFFVIDDKEPGNGLEALEHCPACNENGRTGECCASCLKCYKLEQGRVLCEYLRK